VSGTEDTDSAGHLFYINQQIPPCGLWGILLHSIAGWMQLAQQVCRHYTASVASDCT